MKISKIRNVRTPERAHENDAGIDIFFPTDLTVNDLRAVKNQGKDVRVISNSKTGIIEKIELDPGKRVIIPSGIRMNVPKGYAAIVFNKSGVASSTGLSKLAEVIDSGYNGEVYINLVNTSKNEVVTILPTESKKMVQILIVPISLEDVELVDDTKLFSEKTERGDGGFGSSDEINKKSPVPAVDFSTANIAGTTNNNEVYSFTYTSDRTSPTITKTEEISGVGDLTETDTEQVKSVVKGKRRGRAKIK